MEKDLLSRTALAVRSQDVSSTLRATYPSKRITCRLVLYFIAVAVHYALQIGERVMVLQMDLNLRMLIRFEATKSCHCQPIRLS